jgi:16S rRNA (uracil1498-N3)-methyltransferase
MTRRRWIADEVSGNNAALVGQHADHLARVLRARIGDEFDIATGPEIRRGTITTIDHDRVEFLLSEERPRLSHMNGDAKVTLALSIFKFDRMEWAIEKCTELGVARIIPMIARRTDTHLAAAAMKRHERWQRIVRQASEQSRGLLCPEISSPVKLKDVTSAVAANGAARIVLAESEQETRLRDALEPLSDSDEVMLAIGPEGGWADEELQWFKESGWVAATLGDSILRAETAAIVATALVLDELR